MVPTQQRDDGGLTSILTGGGGGGGGMSRTGTDITNLLTGNGGATRGTGDITSILTGGELNRTDSLNFNNQETIRAIYDFLGGGTLQANLDAQRNQLIGQHGITQGYEDLARRGLLNDAELARRGLALDQGNVNIGRGAANRDLSAIAQLLGLNDQSLARNLGTIAELLNLNAGDWWTRTAGINLSEDVNRRGLRDDSVARGAFNAPGTRQGFSDIEREAAIARQAAEIGYKQTKVGLEDRRGAAQEDHARTRIGLNRQAGDARDTLARLDNEAARLGLTADQISNTLNMGLERLGLESLTNANDLIQRLNSANVEQATMAANLLAQAAQLAGLEGIADIVGGGGTGGTGTSTRTGGATTGITRPR